MVSLNDNELLQVHGGSSSACVIGSVEILIVSIQLTLTLGKTDHTIGSETYSTYGEDEQSCLLKEHPINGLPGGQSDGVRLTTKDKKISR